MFWVDPTGRVALHQADCLDVLRRMPDARVDLTVTSPPYDNLRTYNGSLDDWGPGKWEPIIGDLFRVTRPGGVVVWIVADATIDGSETGSSFRQALHFKDVGFRLHDTMIWRKDGFTSPGDLAVRYGPCFEFMFVMVRGALGVFKPIKDRLNKSYGRGKTGTIRLQDRVGHPAPFPIRLAQDHIVSWSNKDATVLDPFAGAASTGIAALRTGRRFVGIERDPEYFDMAKARLEAELEGERNK